jgi:FtsP/CotA-like multicopper oxidase with cupredoxin domain
MQFRVVDRDALPLIELPTLLPAAPFPGVATVMRDVSLNEEESRTVFVEFDGEDLVVPVTLNCDLDTPFGPTSALLGTLNPDGTGNPLTWMAPITENPAVGAIEEWTIHNFTMDAHPIHVHQVHFEVVNREDAGGAVRNPEIWETGYKDTVISYPGEITRIKALYDLPGYYVWHCHIVEHEDNEMMRPFHVGPIPTDGPAE